MGGKAGRTWASAALLVLGGTAGASAETQVWRFDWPGAGGYRMEGALAYDARPATALVREEDVRCFVIEGFQNEVSIGRWALTMLRPQTTWRLTFDAAAGAFVVFGPETSMPQAWNMDGHGTDCGRGGFGFNIGNAAQDLCADGRLLYFSQVDPERPFPAQPAPGFSFPPDACIGPPLVGALELREPAVAAAASR